MRQLESLSTSLLRLMPRLPSDATPAGAAVFAHLRILLHAPAELPHEVEGLLIHWLEVEEGKGAKDEEPSALPSSVISPLLARALASMRSASFSFSDLEGLDALVEEEDEGLDAALMDDEQSFRSEGEGGDAGHNSLRDEGIEDAPQPQAAELRAIAELRWLVLGRATLGLLSWW